MVLGRVDEYGHVGWHTDSLRLELPIRAHDVTPLDHGRSGGLNFRPHMLASSSPAHWSSSRWAQEAVARILLIKDPDLFAFQITSDNQSLGYLQSPWHIKSIGSISYRVFQTHLGQPCAICGDGDVFALAGGWE